MSATLSGSKNPAPDENPTRLLHSATMTQPLNALQSHDFQNLERHLHMLVEYDTG